MYNLISHEIIITGVHPGQPLSAPPPTPTVEQVEWELWLVLGDGGVIESQSVIESRRQLRICYVCRIKTPTAGLPASFLPVYSQPPFLDAASLGWTRPYFWTPSPPALSKAVQCYLHSLIQSFYLASSQFFMLLLSHLIQGEQNSWSQGCSSGVDCLPRVLDAMGSLYHHPQHCV